MGEVVESSNLVTILVQDDIMVTSSPWLITKAGLRLLLTIKNLH